MKASSLIAAIMLAAALLSPQAGAQEGYDIYLTAKVNGDVPLREPSTTFSCSDKIYGVVEIKRPQDGTGQHTLHATWRNPAGEDQEITEYQFQLNEGHARIWVWLKLNRSGEAALVQFVNPSAGMEEFVGDWLLEIEIDGEDVAKKGFEVLC